MEMLNIEVLKKIIEIVPDDFIVEFKKMKSILP